MAVTTPYRLLSFSSWIFVILRIVVWSYFSMASFFVSLIVLKVLRYELRLSIREIIRLKHPPASDPHLGHQDQQQPNDTVLTSTPLLTDSIIDDEICEYDSIPPFGFAVFLIYSG
ncbi:hypothetical protein RF11_03554 [Thelohanellus kitauei]|uniref:Uncharacterized protein n=1 Tax=Thelohanellus kitauei TaxID=669202 RepID=A0A0C2MPV0_THEKT|nr:hypothetical protein RF11_03554 [Thelohanellus kitauei]